MRYPKGAGFNAADGMMKLLADLLHRLFALVFLALGVTACAVCPVLGVRGIERENLLQKEGAVTEAVITGIQVDPLHKSGVDYVIRYQFFAGDRGNAFSYADLLGRRELWYPPSQAEWSAIEETNRIRILYLPDDPWINRPLDRSPMVDNIALIAMGGTAGALSAYGIAVYVERRLRLRYYADCVPPETINAIAAYLRRVQTEGEKPNSVVFTLGSEKKFWIRISGKPGSPVLAAEAEDYGSAERPLSLSRKKIMRLRSLGWNRPNLRHRGHHHREWRAGSDADRRRIACQVIQTFHEVYGSDVHSPLGVHDPAARGGG
jgi:hypothetical protein